MRKALMANYVAICTGRVEAKADAAGQGSGIGTLQSARGVWRQRTNSWRTHRKSSPLQSARGVWRQSVRLRPIGSTARLQSARGVWRQSLGCLAYRIGSICCNLHGACGGKVKRSQERGGKLHVAICTGRAEKPNGIILRKNPRKFMQTYCIFIHFGV